jgi:peptidoglycan/LPS O-acetylase OafA/YrhL
MFFLVGHFARLVYCEFTRNQGAANLVFLLFFVAFLSLNSGLAFDNFFFYASIVAFALGMPYLFEKTKDSRVFNFLGDNTYLLYLCHTFVIYFLYPASYAPFSTYSETTRGLAFVSFATPGGAILNAVMFLSVCVLASVALHVFVERPLAALTRKTFSYLNL